MIKEDTGWREKKQLLSFMKINEVFENSAISGTAVMSQTRNHSTAISPPPSVAEMLQCYGMLMNILPAKECSCQYEGFIVLSFLPPPLYFVPSLI